MKSKSELITTILGGDQLGRGGRGAQSAKQNKTFTLLPTLHVVLSNNFPLSALLCVVFDVNNEMLGPMIELVPLL